MAANGGLQRELGRPAATGVSLALRADAAGPLIVEGTRHRLCCYDCAPASPTYSRGATGASARVAGGWPSRVYQLQLRAETRLARCYARASARGQAADRGAPAPERR